MSSLAVLVMGISRDRASLASSPAAWLEVLVLLAPGKNLPHAWAHEAIWYKNCVVYPG